MYITLHLDDLVKMDSMIFLNQCICNTLSMNISRSHFHEMIIYPNVIDV